MGGLLSSSKTVQITTDESQKQRSEQLISSQLPVADDSSRAKTDTRSDQTAGKDIETPIEPDNETNKGQITLVASDSTMATYQAKLAEVDAVLEKYADILSEGETKENKDDGNDKKENKETVAAVDDSKINQDHRTQVEKNHVTRHDDMRYEIIGRNELEKDDIIVADQSHVGQLLGHEGHLKNEQMGQTGINDLENIKHMKQIEPVDEYEKEKQEEEILAAVIRGRRKSSLKEYIMNSEDGSLIDLDQDLETVGQKSSLNQEAVASTIDVNTDFSNLVITTSGGFVD